MSDKVIKGIKLIHHNAGGINKEDDPSMPYKLEAVLRPPEFMQVAFIFLYGNEEVVVRGESREALEKFIEAYTLRTNPRLVKLTITGPDGVEDSAPLQKNADSITLSEALSAFDTKPVSRLFKDKDKD